MNYTPLNDSTFEDDNVRMINMMKAFDIPLDYLNADLSDLLDAQTTTQRSKSHDLSKCILNALNYDLQSLTNYGVRVLDPSFLTLLRDAQFIIKFLLFWKTKLFRENIELENHLQDRKKSHKDELKKLEVHHLGKQLTLHLRPKSSTVSECSQCKKVFINDTYLHAHHERRHADAPLNSDRNEIKTLYSELRSLKQQLAEMQFQNELTNTPFLSKSIKMKLIPEMKCLETQEKFWKGKVKEVCDSHEKEKQRLKNIRDNLEHENTCLKKKIDNLTNIRKTNTAETQTEFSGLTLNLEHFQPLRIEKELLPSNFLNSHSSSNSRLKSVSLNMTDAASPTGHLSNSIPNFLSTNFRRWSVDAFSEPPQFFSSNENDIDIVDEVDSFLARCNHDTKVKEKETRSDQNVNKNKCPEKDREVIAKCFPSELMVEKLIEIYDKQGSLVTNEEMTDESEGCDTTKMHSSKSRILPPRKIEEWSKSNEIENESTEKLNTPPKDTDMEKNPGNISATASPPSRKPKSKLLPFLKNIPVKILKNYMKSRKVCIKTIEEKSLDPLSHSRSSSQQSMKVDPAVMKPRDQIEFSDDHLLRSESTNTERDSSYSIDSDLENKRFQPKLVSALKKSKSTGNLVKKVMFADRSNVVVEEKALSPADLLSVNLPTDKIIHTSDEDDESPMPVPAPRAKKNIVSVVNSR